MKASRVFAVAHKELVHIMRDIRTMIIALLMPLILIVLFGAGISFDTDHIALAVADGDRSEASRALIRAFTASGELVRVADIDADDAERVFRRGLASAVLVIPNGYEGQAQLLVDGSDATTANQVLQKVEAFGRIASRSQPAVRLSTVTRYNPEGRSNVFIVPGLTAYVLALGAVLLTALTIASEWERGSMEQLFASPLGRAEIVFGKLLPYLALGFLQLLLVLAVSVSAFAVPIRGNVLLVAPFGLVFLAGMLGQGLLISVVTKNQLVATQAGTMTAMLPSMLLSGMLFPIANMPLPLQALSAVIPARYLVHALRGILLKGNGLAELWPDLFAMTAFACVVLAAATKKFKRRIA